MTQFYRLFCALLAFGVTTVTAMEDHSVRIYKSPISVGTPVSPLVFSPLNFELNGSPTAVIYVRYKGYTCSHCVRQLVYLNEHADDLRRLGIRVVAFSSDDARTSQKMVASLGLSSDVMHVANDVENDVARSIGALRVENDTARDLHAVMVVRSGALAFAAYTDEPFMDVERLISTATDGKTPSLDGPASGKGLRSYSGTYTVRTIATAADGVREPKDLDFNSSPLHPNDLWVVLGEPNGAAMLIIHDADKPTQVIRRKKDFRASHFMWRTQAMAFGDNGTFGTAQNGEPGGNDQDYKYMGPTLWSSDTAIFASKYQVEQDMLASHLDMLHQNAYLLGMAHERDNVYWVSDALHRRIGRYDFRDPHEVGGSDHRDGVIRNYTNATLTAPERGRPAHMDFDSEKRWLYYINPGTNTIMRLDTRTGADTGPLFATQFSFENLASFREFTGATVEPAVQLTKDARPVGLDIEGNHMIVGNTDGTVLVYELGATLPVLKHTLDVSPHVAGGVTVGPDGRIWFVDPVNAMVNVIDPDLKETMVASDIIRVTPTAVKMGLIHGIVRPNCDIASFTLTVDAPKGWTVTHPDTVTVTATASPNFTVEVTPDSSALTGYLTVTATALKGGSVLRSSVLVSRSDIRRVVVDDATTEAFDIAEALTQTGRKGYKAMRSEIFLQLVDSLSDIQTLVWNAGSFGELNIAEDVVMRSLMASGREVMLIADNPLYLKTDAPDAAGFFTEFGAKYAGFDVPAGQDDGRRVFQGVPNDPISAGMVGLVAELPRLDQQKEGLEYLPNIKLGLSKPGASNVLVRSNNTITTAVRYDAKLYRSVICGINLARFTDVTERSAFLNKSVAWLEQAETPLPDPTDVAYNEVEPVVGIVHAIGPNPFLDATSVRVQTTTSYADIALYSIAGQRIATLWQGAVEGSMDLRVDGRALSNGTYYVIVRSASKTAYCTIVKRQ